MAALLRGAGRPFALEKLHGGAADEMLVRIVTAEILRAWYVGIGKRRCGPRVLSLR